MFNIRQLRITLILVFLVLAFAGCAQVKFLLNTGKLPDDVAEKIQIRIEENFNFAHLVVIDDQTGNSLLLKNNLKEEDGSLQYVTEPLIWPVPVKNVEKISSHSVLVAKIGEKNDITALPHCHNIGKSDCNLITINDTTVTLCKDDAEIFTKGNNFSSGYDHISQETSIKTVQLPDEIFKELEKLGGRKVNSATFAIIQDVKTGRKILLKSENSKLLVDNNLLDCVEQVKASYHRYDFTYKGSCATAQSDGGGDGTISKRRRC